MALPAQALEIKHPQLLVAAFQLIGQRGGAVFAVVLGVESREDDVAGQLVGLSEPRRRLQHRRHARGVVVGACHQQRPALARAVEVGAQQNRLGAVPAGQVGNRVLRRAQLIDGVGQPQTNLIARLVELRIDLLADQDAAGGARSIGVVGAVGDVAACQAEPAGRAFQVKLGVPDALALVAEGVVGGEGKGGVHRLRRGPEGPVHAQLERRLAAVRGDQPRLPGQHRGDGGRVTLLPAAKPRQLLQTQPLKFRRDVVRGGAVALTAAAAALIFWGGQLPDVGFGAALDRAAEWLHRVDPGRPKKLGLGLGRRVLLGGILCFFSWRLRCGRGLLGGILRAGGHRERKRKCQQKAPYFFHKAPPNQLARRPLDAGPRLPYPRWQGRE